MILFPQASAAPNASQQTLIQENSLKSSISPYYAPQNAKNDTENDNLEAKMKAIIACESGGNPEVCNEEYGCGAGMGLCQLIPSTVKYCEEKLKKEIDPFNPDDNLECGWWLLINEGDKHWEQSRYCWEKLLKENNVNL
jgi:hypothetical protein